MCIPFSVDNIDHRSATPGPYLAACSYGQDASGHRHCRYVVCAGARGRYFDVVDLVTWLEDEARIGKAGALAAQPNRLELVVLD